MKEPQHPVGPAFEQARNQIDDWRRRQIATLTPEQRSQYEALQNDHQRQIGVKETELKAQEKPQTIERAKQLIADRPAPALQPGRQNNDPALRNRMRNAVADYVEGRDTPETKALGPHLRPFTDQASKDVKAAHRDTANAFSQELEHSRDRFLENCAREQQKGKDQKYAVRPDKATALLMTTAKEKSPQDEKWKTAIIEAAKQEARLNRDHDLTKEFNRGAREL